MTQIEKMDRIVRSEMCLAEMSLEPNTTIKRNSHFKHVKSPSLNKFVFVSFSFFTIFVVVNMLVKFSLVFTCWLAKAEVLSVLKI